MEISIKLVILLGKLKGKFKMIIIDDLSYPIIGEWQDLVTIGEEIYMVYIPAGTRIKETEAIENREPLKEITLKFPAIELNYFEKSSRVYYWEKDRFEVICTAD